MRVFTLIVTPSNGRCRDKTPRPERRSGSRREEACLASPAYHTTVFKAQSSLEVHFNSFSPCSMISLMMMMTKSLILYLIAILYLLYIPNESYLRTTFTDENALLAGQVPFYHLCFVKMHLTYPKLGESSIWTRARIHYRWVRITTTS